MKKIALSLAVAIAAGIGAWFVWNPAPKAPDVTFTTLTGDTFETADLKGKVVLVKFWATSCVTCVKQMPDTVDYYEKYKDKGYETIGVAMQYDPANYVLNFVETRKLPFRVALDLDGGIARSFGEVQLTPTSVLLDKRGRIVKRYVGQPDFAELHALVDKLLAET